MACQSPRAKRGNLVCSFGGILNISASRSTICAEGRRSSDSIFFSALVEQLSCRASCSCVHPSALRRRLSHSPNDTSATITLPLYKCVPFCVSERHLLNRDALYSVTVERSIPLREWLIFGSHLVNKK